MSHARAAGRIPPVSFGRFAGRFLIFYALLLAPWPGWNSHYGAWIQTLGRAAYGSEHRRWFVQFAPEARTAGRPFDTRVTLANRELRGPNGRYRAVILEYDTRGLGWVPTALFLALVLAAPVPWPRRGWALLVGMVAVHGWLLLAIGIDLADHGDAASGLGLVNLSRPWKAIVDGLDETLVVQMGPSFVIPVALWALLLFRREDRALLAGPVTAR